MSALPPKADIAERDWDVRFVPKADSCTATILLLFDPSARPKSAEAIRQQMERWMGISVDDDLQV
jgi:hypothetical protein